MELVEGDDLSQRIARGAIPLDEALPIAKQIAEALEAAHEQGIIHRDLKPANIKVRAGRHGEGAGLRAREGDGAGRRDSSEPVACRRRSQRPAMTQTGMILGTAAYMSPEQARGKPVDRRADIWAFGCVLYEMLTGRRAFDGEDTLDVPVRSPGSNPTGVPFPLMCPSPFARCWRVAWSRTPGNVWLTSRSRCSCWTRLHTSHCLAKC